MARQKPGGEGARTPKKTTRAGLPADLFALAEAGGPGIAPDRMTGAATGAGTASPSAPPSAPADAAAMPRDGGSARRAGREPASGLRDQGSLLTAEGPVTPMAPQPHYLAHRARLRERLMTAGAGALADYEMLELVLFRAIPRRDVKPLAKRLIAAFGDLGGVFAAPPARLAEVAGTGHAVIAELKIVEAAAQRLARVRVLDRPALGGWDALIDYCTTAMAHRETEQFRVLYLDRKNMLIADEAQGEGTVDHVPVYPREVARRALALNASAAIIVHNHPSGDIAPSRADIQTTGQVEAALRTVGVVLHDHVVIGRSGASSFRATGLL